MRLVPAFVGLAALAIASSAAAAPVTLSQISFSPEFQVELDEELGAREGEYLRSAVTEAVSNALTRRGANIGAGADITIEISIIDADPNRPTMRQTQGRPGLDPLRSVSTGGAELRAVLRNASGQVVGEVDHRRYDETLSDVFVPPTTWTSAQRSIRQFAGKVADAYADAAG
ncbi:MAG: hypothetical protein K2P70_13190 [Hyphomonadaceae bacterium]|nr:hypothetical protein [Hyphomonadaceae bacterium]